MIPADIIKFTVKKSKPECKELKTVEDVEKFLGNKEHSIIGMISLLIN